MFKNIFGEFVKFVNFLLSVISVNHRNRISNFWKTRQFRQLSWGQNFSANQRLVCIVSEILLALSFSWLFVQLNVGGISYIFAGIFAGIIVLSSCRNCGWQLSPNRSARQIGLILVGLTIGFSNANANFSQVISGIPVFMVVTLFLLLSGVGIGYVYARLTRTNLFTSMLATVPGGVGVMSAIAADYNRNVALVALVQIIRVTSVILLIPLIARTAPTSLISTTKNSSQPNLIHWNLTDILLMLVAIFTAIMVVNIAARMKIPAANFFGALIVGMIFNPLLDIVFPLADISLTPPFLLKIFGQVLLGITIGEYWGKEPPQGKRTIIYAVLTTIMTLIAGAIAAMIAMQLTSWDWLTCLLVTAPGGATEMILVALTLNHNVEIVTAGHLVRLLAINCSLPIWVLLFRHLDRLVDTSAA